MRIFFFCSGGVEFFFAMWAVNEKVWETYDVEPQFHNIFGDSINC